MAFPGTYNFTYYKGDTFEFRVYPKTADGNPFSLSPFVYDHDTDETTIDFDSAVFAFAEVRGGDSATGYHKCYAKISNDQTYITCAIRPEDSAYLNPTKTYVYDVQVSKPSGGGDYPIVITLMTGTISITDQVTSSVPTGP